MTQPTTCDTKFVLQVVILSMESLTEFKTIDAKRIFELREEGRKYPHRPNYGMEQLSSEGKHLDPYGVFEVTQIKPGEYVGIAMNRYIEDFDREAAKTVIEKLSTIFRVAKEDGGIRYIAYPFDIVHNLEDRAGIRCDFPESGVRYHDINKVRIYPSTKWYYNPRISGIAVAVASGYLVYKLPGVLKSPDISFTTALALLSGSSGWFAISSMSSRKNYYGSLVNAFNESEWLVVTPVNKRR